uniref:Uncharacterized protein n=2 Tax=Viruses TaxID=10239 RepID=A0A8S5PIV5_9CAUD|nr:MAG TPA: hypothetical protein [Myoviridae sp. ct0jJ30]DAE31794.1 MAG TPA: hypothetical protein [virus sp. ctBM815]
MFVYLQTVSKLCLLKELRVVKLSQFVSTIRKNV